MILYGLLTLLLAYLLAWLCDSFAATAKYLHAAAWEMTGIFLKVVLFWIGVVLLIAGLLQ